MIPGAPLVTILVATQVLNAVLLLPLLGVIIGIARDAEMMGRYRLSTTGTATYGVTAAVVLLCVVALAVTSGWG